MAKDFDTLQSQMASEMRSGQLFDRAAHMGGITSQGVTRGMSRRRLLKYKRWTNSIWIFQSMVSERTGN